MSRAADLVELGTRRRIHVIGVGGAAMNAIASVLAAMGHAVTGSDLKDSAGLDRLRAQGVEVDVGHDAHQLGDAELVTYSTAIPETNPELRAARDAGLTVLTRSEMLQALAAHSHTVAVAGTHGKTTTSSMLALILVEAGLSPSFIIGGDLNEIGSGAVWDEGEHFVLEADESDGTFVELGAPSVLVTSLDPDHLEHYGSFEGLQAAFGRFVDQAGANRVICADDERLSAMFASVPVRTYGLARDADLRAESVELGRASSRFRLSADGESLGDFELAVGGLHNVVNATGATAMALLLGAEPDDARRALRRFAGVARRFEFRGEMAGVTFVDDYAHLPAEVAAMVRSATGDGWERVVAVFQPHRYSRTAELWRDFGPCFSGVDELVVTDIYPAGEPPRPGITGELVADAVREADPGIPVSYIAALGDVVTHVASRLRPGDLCLTMGAGDLTAIPDRIISELEERR